MSFTPGTCAQNAAVSGATNKSVSCRTPAVSSPSGTCLTLADRIDVRDTPSAGHPESRLVGYVAACGSIRVTQRVLKPDGDVRQDIGLLIARDTAAQSAQVSRVCDPTSRGPHRSGPGVFSGLRSNLHMVSVRGHRFTAPDGLPALSGTHSHPVSCRFSKRKMESKPQTLLAGSGVIAVSQAPGIIHTENLQQIVKTHTHLHIRSIRHQLRIVDLRKTIKIRI